MFRSKSVADIGLRGEPSLGALLTARPTGLDELECWAVLCQAVQALQDLFLSDGACCAPFVTPHTLLLSAKGRVRFGQTGKIFGRNLPVHLVGYLAPEYKNNRQCSDTEIEKMWIYSLGQTLKKATLTSQAATLRLDSVLYQVLNNMTKIPTTARASLMYLLDIISVYCKQKPQNRPFSHIVMDLYQEAMAAIEMELDTFWGLPAMPDIRSPRQTRYETIPRRWMDFAKSRRATKEASTSMEDISFPLRMPDVDEDPPRSMEWCETRRDAGRRRRTTAKSKGGGNPVQRAASRLYRTVGDGHSANGRDCIGPEFVVRSSLPPRRLYVADTKGGVKKDVTVIMLNGQKLSIACNPNSTTAGQIFEAIIQSEHIEENFMLGLSALIAGDFVFLPSDTRICKAMPSPTATCCLFVRVRFFLPSLRGFRGSQTRHLLYLQLRRSILEHQLPCPFGQLVELDGYALQAEFGDYSEKEHGARDYFLLEHYVPESMYSIVDDADGVRRRLIAVHRTRRGLDSEKAEQEFIQLAQTLPHYGGHFYTATWILKDNNKDVWLYISAQGINIYERTNTTNNCGPNLYEMFEWRNIQTLCYSKHYLCILPHVHALHGSVMKKYKLKLDHKKSYFTFRLASLHHQFFLRLRTEYTSLHTLSHQFGVPLKDMKNESNSLHRFATEKADAETEFRIEFRESSRRPSRRRGEPASRRSKSVHDLTAIEAAEDDQNKENEDVHNRSVGAFVLDSGCLSGLPQHLNVVDKRRGVKMGTKAFGNVGSRVSRSMEAVNVSSVEYLEEMSLQSVSLHCSSASRSPMPQTEAFIIDSTLQTCSNQFLPDFQESLNDTLVKRFENISFVDERLLVKVNVKRDEKGSFGMQVTEGSDGNVYVQSVIIGGSAHLTGDVQRGDQIITVDGRTILGMKYDQALELLKHTGNCVNLVLSRASLAGKPDDYNRKVQSTMDLRRFDENCVEKHVMENCYDVSNRGKHGKDVPYHKHIRYGFESGVDLDQLENTNLSKKFSKSCTNLNDRNRAVIVGVIPKNFVITSKLSTLENDDDDDDKVTIPPIALPRSLGLGRKWRGPVKYPVTPIRKGITQTEFDDYPSNSDEEQVFI